LPAWSPDGSKIVFVSNREENKAHFSNDENDVYIMNPDGSGQTNLTTSSANDYFPRWSSDGQIAFVSFRDGNAEIYIMSADGSGQTNLTRNAASDNSPALKP
jgi:Tol biopolymer transport system component